MALRELQSDAVRLKMASCNIGNDGTHVRSRREQRRTVVETLTVAASLRAFTDIVIDSPSPNTSPPTVTVSSKAKGTSNINGNLLIVYLSKEQYRC